MHATWTGVGAVLFCTGLLVALQACGGGSVAGAVSSVATGRTTSTSSAAAPAPSTVTEQSAPSTVTHEATVERTVATTVTSPAPTVTSPPPATVAPSSDTSSNDQSWWLAILVIVLGAGVIAGVVMLVRRPKAAKSAVTPEGRHARLFDAVQSWIAQGWSVEREENEEAVLAKGAQRMLVAVDAEGRVSTNALADAPAR